MRFKLNGNGTVTDTKTGLMWQADPFCPLTEVNRFRFLLMVGNVKCLEDHRFTKQEAENYATCLSFAGYDDWRLPSVLELHDLAGSMHRQTVFENIQMDGYWSSTPTTDNINFMHPVDLDGYYKDYDQSDQSKSYNVLCVRDDKARKKMRKKKGS